MQELRLAPQPNSSSVSTGNGGGDDVAVASQGGSAVGEAPAITTGTATATTTATAHPASHFGIVWPSQDFRPRNLGIACSANASSACCHLFVQNTASYCKQGSAFRGSPGVLYWPQGCCIGPRMIHWPKGAVLAQGCWHANHIFCQKHGFWAQF